MKESCIITGINPRDLKEKNFQSLKEVWQDLLTSYWKFNK